MDKCLCLVVSKMSQVWSWWSITAPRKSTKENQLHQNPPTFFFLKKKHPHAQLCCKINMLQQECMIQKKKKFNKYASMFSILLIHKAISTFPTKTVFFLLRTIFIFYFYKCNWKGSDIPSYLDYINSQLIHEIGGRVVNKK